MAVEGEAVGGAGDEAGAGVRYNAAFLRRSRVKSPFICVFIQQRVALPSRNISVGEVAAFPRPASFGGIHVRLFSAIALIVSSGLVSGIIAPRVDAIVTLGNSFVQVVLRSSP